MLSLIVRTRPAPSWSEAAAGLWRHIFWLRYCRMATLCQRKQNKRARNSATPSAKVMTFMCLAIQVGQQWAWETRVVWEQAHELMHVVWRRQSGDACVIIVILWQAELCRVAGSYVVCRASCSRVCQPSPTLSHARPGSWLSGRPVASSWPKHSKPTSSSVAKHA